MDFNGAPIPARSGSFIWPITFGAFSNCAKDGLPIAAPSTCEPTLNTFQIIALVLTLAALASYANERLLGLPPSIGLMLLALGGSLLLILGNQLGLHLDQPARRLVQQIDFSQTLLNGMLSFLLFAGSLHVDLKSLREEVWNVAALATIGVVLSTFAVAVLMAATFRGLGLPIPFAASLVFGALISPTDPVAVLALLKRANSSQALATRIAGESLLNDGVGVVLFIICAESYAAGHGLNWRLAGELALREGVGGIALGLALGWVTFHLLKPLDNYRVEVLLTLALVAGGYALASALHTSGLLAMVAAGLMIGNPGREFAMSEVTRQNLDLFWELIDEVLNAVLFMLVGLVVLTIPLRATYLVAALTAIPIVLLARFLSVGATVALLRPAGTLGPHTVKILTWGGLRGGISVALALSLPPSPVRDVLLTATYAVVIFSIGVQGLTTPSLLRRTGLAITPAAPL
jgi:CPA1 family monovalent cation:H+ antiporter